MKSRLWLTVILALMIGACGSDGGAGGLAGDGGPGSFCHTDSDCPTGSVCAGAGMVSPGECHKKCSSAADCRTSEGYVCKMMPDDASSAYCDAPEEETGDGGA